MTARVYPYANAGNGWILYIEDGYSTEHSWLPYGKVYLVTE